MARARRPRRTARVPVSAQLGAELHRRARACAGRDRRRASGRRPVQQRRATREPTCPRPITHDARPLSDASRTRAHSTARIAVSTPSAVNGLGSPEPPLPAGESGDVPRPLGDHVHVAARGADVLGGDVVAVQRVDRVGEIEQRVVAAPRRQVVPGSDHDHALAAAERRGRRPPPCRSSLATAGARRATPRASPRTPTSGSRRAMAREPSSGPRRS